LQFTRTLRLLTLPGLLTCALSSAASGQDSTTAASNSAFSGWQGKTVALSNRPMVNFLPNTSGGTLYGVKGMIDMVDAGRQLVTEYSLQDPAPAMARQLLQAAQERYGVVPANAATVSVDETAVGKLAQAAHGADLLFDLQLVGWGIRHVPLHPLQYWVNFSATVRIIDVGKAALLGTRTCHAGDDSDSELSTYDALVADHAALLKSRLGRDADRCVSEFKAQVLHIPG
jgi:hypothetical protein